LLYKFLFFLFFFQAEDGIRDRNVTGVQTCALPILFSISFTTSSFSYILFNFEYTYPNPLRPISSIIPINISTIFLKFFIISPLNFTFLFKINQLLTFYHIVIIISIFIFCYIFVK